MSGLRVFNHHTYVLYLFYFNIMEYGPIACVLFTEKLIIPFFYLYLSSKVCLCCVSYGGIFFAMPSAY